jgi:hypothetical protein
MRFADAIPSDEQHRGNPTQDRIAVMSPVAEIASRSPVFGGSEEVLRGMRFPMTLKHAVLMRRSAFAFAPFAVVAKSPQKTKERLFVVDCLETRHPLLLAALEFFFL